MIHFLKDFLRVTKLAGRHLTKQFDAVNIILFLTLSPSLTTIGAYAKRLDRDETQSNLVSHPNPSCLTLRQHFHQL